MKNGSNVIIEIYKRCLYCPEIKVISKHVTGTQYGLRLGFPYYDLTTP